MKSDFSMLYFSIMLLVDYLAIPFRQLLFATVLVNIISISIFSSNAASAEPIFIKQYVAEASFGNDYVSQFYKNRNYDPFWLGNSVENDARLQALIGALSDAPMHGLPSSKFSFKRILSDIYGVSYNEKLGYLDVKLTLVFLEYARVMTTGVLIPEEIDKKIVRSDFYKKNVEFLNELDWSNPFETFKKLFPPSLEYRRLMKEKKRLDKVLLSGGWGAFITSNELLVGERSSEVIMLRDRLVSMEYLSPTYSTTYDLPLVNAVRNFQVDNGIHADGSANQSTLKLINVTVAERLKSVLVALERERWSRTLGTNRHVIVNLTDFSAKIVDSGKVTFETKTVIGFDDFNRRSPEFSDILEFMVVNPSWYVPRSIVVQEYLPMLKVNNNAVNFLELRDDFGTIIEASEIDFSNFDQKTFPYRMRQPPGVSNALGLVKFMFPNKNNIYLHDTPSKGLFDLDVRAFSHGCIRLSDPFGFAYTLLAAQSADPESLFRAALGSKKEIKIELEKPIPIHLIYRTAITRPGGGLEFRKDIYGRDAKIWAALQAEGVVLVSVNG